MGVCNLSARMLVKAATLVLVSVLSVEGAPVASPSNWWSSYITDYLPPTIQKLVNDTIDQGTDVVYDLYDDIKEEVIDKSADNIGKITYTLNAMMGRLNDISDKVDTIMTRRKLTKKEMLEVQERVAELESEIARDKFNDEKMIQMFLTSVREMMIQWNNEDAMFFSNVKSIEEQFYNFNQVVADGSGDLKTEIKKLFETMRNIDLNKIGALEEAKDNDEDDEIPRNF